MKSLADLKRVIKPGLRLRCIANTFRPELNGRERIVTRIQTNGFYWKDPGPHDLNIRSLRDADAVCSCGGWCITFPAFDTEKDEYIRGRIEEDFAGHKHRATREAWTAYQKSGAFQFDGSNCFRMRLWSDTDKFVHLEVL
jgi:hypothetical protein